MVRSVWISNMEFEALVQGETRLEQKGAEVTDANGETLNLFRSSGILRCKD